MGKPGRILVVATTWDYIDLIQAGFPGRALFLTGAGERERAPVAPPPASQEVLCNLQDRGDVRRALEEHLRRWPSALAGIVAFDCESLGLAAELGQDLGLAFASPEAIAACRDKVVCKKVWRRAGVQCPRADVAESPGQAIEFMRALKGPVVLKPLSGTGSQGVFKCADPAEVERCFPPTLAQSQDAGGNPTGIAVEELIPGQEFSCDFLLEKGKLALLRVARKQPHPLLGAGTTLAYLVSSGMGGPRKNLILRRDLRTALNSLGIQRAMGMADFFWRHGRPCFLELAPRPSGDCLPWVLQKASGLDLWKIALDFSQGISPESGRIHHWRPVAGLMLYAQEHGRLNEKALRAMGQDPRILEVKLNEPMGSFAPCSGDEAAPQRLGHVIFRPHNPAHFGEEALALERALTSGLEIAA